MFSCTLHGVEIVLEPATVNDLLPIEHFADAVLRDDFFFRKGHWLSLLADRRVKLFTIRARTPESGELQEIMGIVVLYDDSTLHNLFLAKQWRGLGIGGAVVGLLTPLRIRVKTNMTAGDPTGFYQKLGFTEEIAREGKKGQISVLRRPPTDDLFSPSGAPESGPYGNC